MKLKNKRTGTVIKKKEKAKAPFRTNPKRAV
jgi:hypothetical protein